MKILHVVAGLPPGGGIAESVPSLCRHLRQLGHEVALATLDGPLSEAARAAEAADVRLVRFAPSFPRALYFSWQMLRGLPALAHAADVVHVHGAWTFPVWWGCCCALRSRKPLVMSPRGALNPVYLKHSAWKKRLVGWLDRSFLKKASVIHATAQCEREWVRAYLEGCDAEIAVIPNGVEVDSSLVHYCESALVEKSEVGGRRSEVRGQRPEGGFGPTHELTNSRTDEPPTGSAFGLQPSAFSLDAERTRTVLYLGRLHPLKGLELLIEAWSGLKELESGKPLTVNGQLLAVSGKSGNVCGRTEVPKETDYDLRLTVNGTPWQLVVAGPDEQGMLARLKAQAERLGLRVENKCVHALMRECVNEGEKNKVITHSGNNAFLPDILFTGPVYGEEKARVMAYADLFVLPTRSENFGLAVAEALACGVPVITTKGAPWQELENCGNALMRECVNEEEGNCGNALMRECVNEEEENCGNALMRECFNKQEDNQAITQSGIKEIRPVRAGWWIDVGVEPLAEALREAMSLTDEERHEMGENGRRLVDSKYRWETVAERMAGVYEKCVNAGLR